MADSSSYKMKLFVVGCVLIAYFVHILVANPKGCSFPVHVQSEKNSPIFLHNNSALIVPNNGKINLNARETVTVICPDSKNYLVATHSNVSHAQCVRGTIVRVANQDINFSDLQCQRVIRGVVSKTSRRCGGNSGEIYKIGYQMSQRSFITVIEVCYDSGVGNVLYTEHLLHGRDIKYASKSNYRPAFSPEGSTVSVSVAYKQTFQKATLNKLLKSSLVAHEYINENSYLVRGHLSPDADFLLAATQYTSYYYLNVCPQWNVINAANWKKVEMMVRKAADNLQETFTIITGTHDVLTLPDVNGNPANIFLVSGNKLPVPKYVWKLVLSKDSQKAIVIVSLNDPFIEQVQDSDFLCKDICHKSGWASKSWLEYERGFIYCCDYKQFEQVVQSAPKLTVRGILQGPK